jgi:hypothetical protein
VAVVTWPVAGVIPVIGIDMSWRIGLAMAARDRMSWGDDLLFTYGPLGFLENPLLVSTPGLVLALLWTFALQALMALSIILAGNRSFPWPVGVALAFAAGIVGFDNRETLAMIVFLWAAMAIAGDVGPRLGRVLVPVGGAVSALALLDKFNVGVVCILLTALAVPWLAPGRWRALAVASGAFLATFLVMWLALGGSLDEIVPWLRGTAELGSGFSAGMPVEDPSRAWEYPVFAVGVAGLAVGAWLYSARLSRGRAVCLAVVGACLAVFVYAVAG